MNEINQDNKKEIICSCTGTSKDKIEELIDKGIDNVDKIASATGATTGCGACDVTILEILRKYNGLEKK